MNRKITKRAASLPQLAEQINAEHDAARSAFMTGFKHALQCGDLLIEAKAKVKHGEWLRWLADNSTVAERTAHLYMRVARERPRLETKSATIADLTLNQAVKLLAKPQQQNAAEATALSRSLNEASDGELQEVASQIAEELNRRSRPRTREEWAAIINAEWQKGVESSRAARAHLEVVKQGMEEAGLGDIRLIEWSPEDPFGELLGYPETVGALIAGLEELEQGSVGAAQ